MVKILVNTEEDKEKCKSLESILKNFPLLKETDAIQIISHNNKIAIAYLTEGNMRINQTHFDLEIREDMENSVNYVTQIENSPDRDSAKRRSTISRMLCICDILDFEIKREFAGKGHGKALYLIIEEFAKYLNCKKIQTSPSGEGVTFWPYMGFKSNCKELQ